MTQRTIDLLIRIAIEIVEWINRHTEKKRGPNDSKGTSEKKRKGCRILRVLQTEDGSYYVESAEGKIQYNRSA